MGVLMRIPDLMWYLISTLIYIPISGDTSRAHEHTGFWYIYGRAYKNPLSWYLISTLVYIPKSVGIGRAHEQTIIFLRAWPVHT
jgi:hypothetical protein